MRASVLLIEPAVEVAAPAPFLGSDHERRRVGRFDLRREIDHPVPDLVHGRPGRAHVPMSRVPDARLVVENVVAQAAGRVRAPAGDQMLHPALLKDRVRRHVGVVRIVARDELTVGPDAVARIGEPLPVVAALRAVLGDREPGELGSARTDLGDPLDRGNRQHRPGIRRARIGDERVAALPGRRAAVGDALVVPIVAAIVRVELPVVPRGVVSAMTVQRRVQVVQLRRRRVRHAVDVGVDRTAIGGGIDGDGDRRVLGNPGKRVTHERERHGHSCLDRTRVLLSRTRPIQTGFVRHGGDGGTRRIRAARDAGVALRLARPKCSLRAGRV